MSSEHRSVARYAPERTFPAYAFLPGRDPHPTRDARGHSYRTQPEPPATYHAPEDWRDNEDYLFGVDLYNHGFLWEAHEAWEGSWHASKHDPLQAEFLQGLIQCAAACLKVPMEQPAGLARLCSLGTTRLERVGIEAGATRFMGLEIAGFVLAMRAFAAARPSVGEDHPHIVLAQWGERGEK